MRKEIENQNNRTYHKFFVEEHFDDDNFYNNGGGGQGIDDDPSTYAAKSDDLRGRHERRVLPLHAQLRWPSEGQECERVQTVQGL